MIGQSITDWISSTLGLDPGIQARILRSIVAILLLVVLSRIILRIALARSTEMRTGYYARKIAAYVTFALAFVIVGRIWFGGIDSVTTFAGLVAAGLVVALQDPIANVAGWMFIIWRRPFEFGDRIQIGDHVGDVVDLRVFQFSLLELRDWVDADQPTGRILHVPNSYVFTEPQANYSKGIRCIWDELPVDITFESNWQAAKGLLEDIARRHSESIETMSNREARQLSNQLMRQHADLTPHVYTTIQDRGVRLTLRYLCDPTRRRATAAAVGEDILHEILSRSDIRLAYPAIRYYGAHTEDGAGDRRNGPE